MILRAVKSWRVASLVYNTEQKQKINEQWTENKSILAGLIVECLNNGESIKHSIKTKLYSVI